MLASAGLTMDDVKTVPTQSLFSGVDLLGEGKVEAATISVGTGQGQQANVKLASRGGVRFINMDVLAEAVARIRKVLPARPIVVEPAAYAVGIHRPDDGHGLQYFLHDQRQDARRRRLQHRQDAPGEQGRSGQGAAGVPGFDPKAMTEEIDVPWHPGAIKFYKEIGQWPPKG